MTIKHNTTIQGVGKRLALLNKKMHCIKLVILLNAKYTVLALLNTKHTLLNTKCKLKR